MNTEIKIRQILTHVNNDKERIDNELLHMKEINVLEDIYTLYTKVKDNRISPGNNNIINSAVGYYLGITTQKHKPDQPLQIERRRTYARDGFPDIDMDFDYAERHKIVSYLRNKYGEDKVASIGTVQTLKTKSAVRRTIKILDPENSVVYNKEGKKVKDAQSENFKLENVIVKTIPEFMKRPDGTFVDSVEEAYQEYPEFRKFMDQYPEVRRVSGRLEGSISATGCHAAGIVISPLPLKYICPLHLTKDTAADDDENKSQKVAATQFTMSEVEALGLIKIDILGLSTKTALKRACDLIKDRYGKEIDLANLPLNDKATLRLLSSGKTDLCFQLENKGMQMSLVQIGVDSFDDLVAVIAMYRPGPKDYIPNYAKRKKGQEKVVYPHPAYESICKHTYGILCYQEQIFQIFIELASMSSEDAYTFMKGCAKKKQELIDGFKQPFLDGCAKNNISNAVAQSIFSDMSKFGRYAFNKTLHFSEIIPTSDGDHTIEALFKMPKNIRPQVYGPNGQLINITDVYDHGVVPMYKITLSNGMHHVCTLEHKFASNHGVLPLQEIIARGSELLTNRIVRDACQKTVDMPCMQYCNISHRTVGTQEILSALEADETKTLFNRESEKFQTLLGQYNSRRVAYVQGQSIKISFTGDTTKYRGEAAQICPNEENKYSLSRLVPKKSHRNSSKNFCQTRYIRITHLSSKTMERKKSIALLRKMHQTGYGAESLEVCSRKTLKTNFNSPWIQVFAGREKSIVYNKVQVSSGRFYKLREKNCGRIRWTTPFSGRIWHVKERTYSWRRMSERCNEKLWLYDDSNILRYLGATKEKIQVHRDTNVTRHNSEQHRTSLQDTDWSYVQIARIEPVGFCQGYDIGVDSSDHLYCLSSGVVNSNSHSVSYGYESYKSAYLKTHYTVELFAARLSVELVRRKFDEVEKYEYDAEHNFGIKFLPPDLNKSKLHYVIVDDKTLLRPILSKGIGMKAASSIVEHQPYTGSDRLFAFASKAGQAVNTKVIESMCDAGIWGKVKKSSIIQDFEQIKKDKKINRGKPSGDIFD